MLGLLAAVLAWGCGGIPKTDFYTLQAPAPAAPSAPKTPYVLGVEHFRSPAVLRDDRVVYYVSPTRMNFYEHHRWGAEPATLLTELTARWLESSAVFAQVKMFPLRERVDYTLGGEVAHFEEVDSDHGVKVRLELGLSVVRTRDRKVVWSGQEHRELPLQGQGVDGVASTLNAACAQALAQMVPPLLAQVIQDFNRSGN